MPFSPRCARNCFWWRKSTRVLRFSDASSHTLPPSPPSPPSGPPSGMNFSRRNPTQPLPPLPAVTVISASSTSFILVSIGSQNDFGPLHRRIERGVSSTEQAHLTAGITLPVGQKIEAGHTVFLPIDQFQPQVRAPLRVASQHLHAPMHRH